MRKIIFLSFALLIFPFLLTKQASADCSNYNAATVKVTVDPSSSGDTKTKFKINGQVDGCNDFNLRVGANLVGAPDGAPDSQESQQSVPVDAKGSFSTYLILPTAGSWDLVIQPMNSPGTFLKINPNITFTVAQGAPLQSGDQTTPNSTACPDGQPAVFTNGGSWICGGGDTCDLGTNKPCTGTAKDTCLLNSQGEPRCGALPTDTQPCYPNGQANGKCGLGSDGKPLFCVIDDNSTTTPKTYICRNSSDAQTPPCAVDKYTIPALSGLDNGKDIGQTTIKLDNCSGVYTALGFVLNTNAPDAVKGLFAVILSIIGGVALVRIILAGLTIMTSAGNPDKIKEAREGLQSALIGLVFALLSMVILQTIGYDILHIPGIGK